MSVEEGGSSGRRRESVKVAISDEEKAVYDRQIRLWGLEAQNRLRNSSVLIAGLSGCGAEVAKNLMLAGLKSITLLDHRKASRELGIRPSSSFVRMVLLCGNVAGTKAIVFDVLG
uniref:THIF-type NAD/FAD binding fold domain-containing protein n=1 Tax=Parascaris equorum TaxID=6256 RepID=A0A914RTN8_PAREQ